ncbi:MAG: 16S rRNA (guanine(527)-N(7))-methyltransferase RsmG [Pseudomonadota bacterium]
MHDLTTGAERMGVNLSENAKDRLFLYYSELLRWNSKVNLVSRRDHDWLRIHFLDSLAPIGIGLLRGDVKVVDLGAGAGFPGVPLKLACEDIFLALAEASGKKCAWLKHIIRVLRLDDARVLEGRFEELLSSGWAGSFDVVVSRAAAKPRRILELARPFLCPGGRTLIYTTEALVDGSAGKVYPYKVPGSKVPSVIWEVEC